MSPRHKISVLCVYLQDNGDSFSYTGSGGRDLSGNKRTAEQSCDQTLTRMNRYVCFMYLGEVGFSC